MDDPDGVVRLLVEIVRGAPSLPSAACRGRHELYDDVAGRGPEHHVQERQRLQRAAAVCSHLPGPRARQPSSNLPEGS